MTPPHCHGHAHRCADVCAQEQAADSWPKANAYARLRNGDREDTEMPSERYTKGEEEDRMEQGDVNRG